MNENKTNITPDTKVAELLNDYPELEEMLKAFSPAFAALKNPVLRKTVAKVTSLQQAAKVGNVNVVEMVSTLRKEVGMASLEENFHSGYEDHPVPVAKKGPDTAVTFTLDVRPIIDAGDHPKDAVLAQAEKLRPGECMEFIAPFPPIPLINLLQKRGYKITMLAPTEGIVRTYVER
jgi:Domain of unknown function (DUF1858)./Uncharacterized conserved protein (DUF2249).